MVDDDVTLGGQAIDERRSGAILPRAGDDAIRHREHLRPQAVSRPRHAPSVSGLCPVTARRRRSTNMPSVSTSCGSSRPPRPCGRQGGGGASSGTNDGWCVARCSSIPIVSDRVSVQTPYTSHPPGCDELDRGVDELGLQCGEAAFVVRCDAPPRVGSAAQHTETRARRVDQHASERTRRVRRPAAVRDDRNRVAASRDAGREVVGADIVATQSIDVRGHRPHPRLPHVGCEHRGARGCHGSRLAAGRGTDVRDAHAGGRLDEPGHPLRRLVLDVAVAAHPHPGRLIHVCERRERVGLPQIFDEARSTIQSG